jgi:hypothetical protein
MEAAFFIGIFIISFVGWIFWSQFLTRIKKGIFVCETKGRNKQIIKTDYGTFMIDGHEKKVDWSTPNGKITSFAFDEIKGIKFSYDETSAFLTEYFLSDFGITDLLSKYEDKNTTYLISLVLNNQTSQMKYDKIPLFVAQQYEIRDMIPVTPFLLQALSLYKDVGDYSRGVLDEIISKFERSGKKLTLI